MQRSKVQLAPPTRKICDIQDGRIIVAVCITIIIIIIIIIFNFIIIVIKWNKGRKNDSLKVFIQSHSLPLCKRDINHKHLGKSLFVCGEHKKQIDEFVNKYQKLIDQIKLSVLPISLKCSIFTNLALAKILHHFYNTRLSEIRINLMEKHLVTAVTDLLKLL